ELYGADRVMFGSDFPMWDPKSEFDFLASLELPAADFEKITWRNAERFLNMPIE
ncbi:MAG: amidohydrolase family protein, partial [Eggerthellaceae bacterium]|nr:amidohydrolase family protein [Eggerthellaceae bacterium]